MLQNGIGKFSCVAFHCKIGHQLYRIAGTEMVNIKQTHSKLLVPCRAREVHGGNVAMMDHGESRESLALWALQETLEKLDRRAHPGKQGL